MSYEIEHLAKAIKAARERKNLSQRELKAKTGIPQAQISKFESGIVDLRLSSLITLARALDLDLELIPLKALPAVQSVIRRTEQLTNSMHASGETPPPKPAYSLEEDEDA
jgi:transcriptional regulator with XRE-family HTH domain